MSRLNLLILDANVVICLHDAGAWKKFIELCDVHLPETVIEEAAFHDDDEDERHYIDLSDDIESGRVTTFTVPLSDLQEFQSQFDSQYVGELDPGELEALAFLCNSREDFVISSGDAIVYRVLGRLGKASQGISLEEILTRIGLQQSALLHQFTKQFRESVSAQGFQDMMRGRGLK